MINKKSKILFVVLSIYILCFMFRWFDYFILRTDQTFLGEAIMHKVIGIIIFYGITKIYAIHLKDIGFEKKNILQNFFKGIAFALSVFIVAYIVEILILVFHDKFETIDIYVSAYMVYGNIGNQTSFTFFTICIIGNIINVVMEEGLFRGLFKNMLEHKYSFIVSALISSVLFGVWHIISPIRSYYDGMIGVNVLVINLIILISTSSIIGFKFYLITKITGSLYMSMGDHFINNTIVNMVHIISDTGADELQIMRISVAQTLSFVIVLIYYIRKKIHESKSISK